MDPETRERTEKNISETEMLRHLAYGEAAWMLMESLLLVLGERGKLTAEEMSDAVETALSAKRQMVLEKEHPQIARVAAGLLSTLANSLAARK